MYAPCVPRGALSALVGANYTAARLGRMALVTTSLASQGASSALFLALTRGGGGSSSSSDSDAEATAARLAAAAGGEGAAADGMDVAKALHIVTSHYKSRRGKKGKRRKEGKHRHKHRHKKKHKRHKR